MRLRERVRGGSRPGATTPAWVSEAFVYDLKTWQYKTLADTRGQRRARRAACRAPVQEFGLHQSAAERCRVRTFVASLRRITSSLGLLSQANSSRWTARSELLSTSSGG